MTQDLVTSALPSEFFRIVEGSFELVPVASVFQGTLINTMRYGGPRFMRWRCSLQSTMLERENWQAYQAWRARIGAGPKAFELHDPAKELPLGNGGGFDPDSATPGFEDPDESITYFDGRFHDGGTFLKLKQDAPRYADVILVEDCPVSQTILKSGDHFSLGGNLYLVTGDVISDSNGDAAITFVWRLHKAQLAGDLVTLRNPTGRFMLQNLDGGGVERTVANHGRYTIEAVEFPYT